VLSMLVRARHDDGSPMSEQEVRDELLALPVAGHGTTASGLAWAVERSIRHSEVQWRLGRFRPERFLKDRPGTCTWLAFGGGVRRCLGVTFAESEL
jgi:cytochrome P450